MEKKILLVKIFDLNKNTIGKGNLLNIQNNLIIIKGNNLPILSSGFEIIVEIYDELVGISPYLCKVSVGSRHQLNAAIIRKEPIIERRNALKVRTNLSFYVSQINRNDEDITDELPDIKINVLNLSIGGMLISSNIDLILGDVITYYFKYYKYKSVPLEAKIIRIDNTDECDANEIGVKEENSDSSKNYGCYFLSMSSSSSMVVGTLVMPTLVIQSFLVAAVYVTAPAPAQFNCGTTYLFPPTLDCFSSISFATRDLVDTSHSFIFASRIVSGISRIRFWVTRGPSFAAPFITI